MAAAQGTIYDTNYNPTEAMNKYVVGTIVLILALGLSSMRSDREEWGFFGHRRINRMATFTLPAELMPFFRPHIDYLTEHAVDPDKRRYATRHEAVRHYIDIDHWGTAPFANVPRDWTDALLKFAEIQLIDGTDTTRLTVDTLLAPDKRNATVFLRTDSDTLIYSLPLQDYRTFWREKIIPQYYEDEWTLACTDLSALLKELPGGCTTVRIVDHFSEYGIVPYHLMAMQWRLTEAFRAKDEKRILRLAAEMGHYVADAHVPLHTTENYNGQLTDQLGIHAFWESRLPELFADEEYDYFVGRAEYIENPQAYYWDIVLASHALVDSVLRTEKRLRATFPADQQYCFVDRLGATIRTQCPEFAKAYSDAMQGMVEDRMRRSIRAIGSAWYTAWIDAGQPDLSPDKSAAVEDIQEQDALDREYKEGTNKGREHDGG